MSVPRQPCRPKQDVTVLWDEYAITGLCTEDLQKARQFGIQHARITAMVGHAEKLQRISNSWRATLLSMISGPEHNKWWAAYSEGFELGHPAFKADLTCFLEEDFFALMKDEPIHGIGDQYGARFLGKECGCKCKSGTGCKKKTVSLRDRKWRRVLYSHGKLRTRVSRKSKVFELTDDEQANMHIEEVD